MKWAVLVPAADRPAVLNTYHNDYPLVFRWVPRSLTAFLSDVPPVQIAGTNPPDHHTDVPADGTWSLALPLHIASVTKKRIFSHIGLRYDYNDKYYNLAVAWKKLG